jgi:hypothetical protein
MFGVYQIVVRVAPDDEEGAAGRHQEWMSSATPAVTALTPDSCCHPAMQNSQLPSVGVPVPPPTLAAALRATTVLWSAGGTGPNAVGWVNTAAHWLTTATGEVAAHGGSKYRRRDRIVRTCTHCGDGPACRVTDGHACP